MLFCWATSRGQSESIALLFFLTFCSQSIKQQKILYVWFRSVQVVDFLSFLQIGASQQYIFIVLSLWQRHTTASASVLLCNGPVLTANVCLVKQFAFVSQPRFNSVSCCRNHGDSWVTSCSGVYADQNVTGVERELIVLAFRRVTSLHSTHLSVCSP